MAFDFFLQILQVIGSFVFSVTRAFGVGIGICKRRCKAGLEGDPKIVIISSCVHIQTDQVSV